MTDIRHKLAFGRIGSFGALFGGPQFALGPFALCDVADKDGPILSPLHIQWVSRYFRFEPFILLPPQTRLDASAGGLI